MNCNAEAGLTRRNLVMIICENVLLEDVRAARPTAIYYGANTCWWTHDPSHLRTTGVTEEDVMRSARNFRANSSTKDAPLGPFIERARKAHGRGLPCDPTGGMLFQTDEVEKFLAEAERNVEHYGPHGLRAFMAAHHSNCFAVDPGSVATPVIIRNELKHFASPDWLTYNEALDALDRAARKGKLGNV